MNKSYRSVWNESLGAWVATSEISKARGKRSGSVKLAAVALAAASLFAGAAHAQLNLAIGSGTGTLADPYVQGTAVVGGIGSVAFGTQSSAVGQYNFALGNGANASGTSGATAIGQLSTASGNYATAFGAGAQAIGDGSYATGNGAKALGTYSSAQGYYAEAHGIASIANGIQAGVGSADTNRNNIALGGAAGQKVLGDSNSAVGTFAGSNISGAAISAVNPVTGNTETGLFNSAMGSFSGNNVTGAANAATGVLSGNSVIGDFNTANNVVLGNDSTDRAYARITQGVVGGQTYGGFAGTAAGVLSVGSVGAERQIVNVAPGAVTSTSTDAINGSQLYSVAAVAGKGWNVTTAQTGTGTASGATVATVAPGDTAKFIAGSAAAAGWNLATAATGSGTARGSALTQVGAGSTATFTAGDNIAITQAGREVQVAVNPNLQVDSVSIQNGGPTIDKAGIAMAPGNTLNMGGNTITHLGAGVNGTDAVNVNQLNTLGGSVAGTIGGNSRYDPVTGTVTGSLAVGGTTYTTVQAALTQVDETASKGWNLTTAATGSGTATGSAVTQVAPGATASFTAGNNIAIVQNGKDVQVAVNPNLKVDSVAIQNGGPTIDKSGIAMAPGNTLNMGGNTITHLGAGVNATDAVNVQQLQASQQGGVRYDSNPDGSINTASVTLNPGGAPAAVHNVAPGVAGTDATNVNQLNSAVGSLNGRINAVDDKLNANTRMLSGGVAAAAAMAVVTPVEPGRYHASGAVASYNGQTGVGLNLLKRSDNGQTTLHAGVGWATGGSKAIVRVGFGFSFD